MGGYAASIGDYALHMGDYVFDYLATSAPKKYFEDINIEMEFIHYLPGMDESNKWIIQRNKAVINIMVPLLKLGSLTLLKKHYRFEPDFNLRRIMWKEIVGRGIIVEGYVGTNSYYEDENGKTIFKYYYLTSKVGEEPIYLQSPTEGVDITQHVRNEAEHIWLIKNGLEFYTEIRK